MTFLSKKTSGSTPIVPLEQGEAKNWLARQDARTKAWAKAAGFTGGPGSTLLVPDGKGGAACVVFGVGRNDSLYTYASLPSTLPVNKGGYYIKGALGAEQATEAALGWALGSYRFDRYKTGKKDEAARLVWPEKADRKYVTAAAEATCLVRDLVNIPSCDLGPAELADVARKIAGKKACKITTGATLAREYPAIHAVGKGSPRSPRLIDFKWGNAKHPKITLVGKGVCFDTGGLNIKTGSYMNLMKKDMGGAAHVLGLAHMVMAAKLPVRLRVLIPAVENSVDGHSFRPGDIIKTRKGLSVEIGDTDAEGRLVLCDALAEACRENPDFIIDFATLTGAARVALGPDLPALFCNDDKAAAKLMQISHQTHDPLWLMPLWKPYNKYLDSKVADTNNVGSTGHGGAITAALYLQKFVDPKISWAHIDTYAWTTSRPGRPEGGDALGMRACFAFLKDKYGGRKK